MEQRVSLITLGVADLDRSTAFYERLGWRRAGDFTGVAFFQCGPLAVALWARTELAADAGLDPGGGGFSGIALAYNTRDRAEVDVVLAQFADAGGALVKPGAPTPYGGYAGYATDLDGHLWEIA